MLKGLIGVGVLALISVTLVSIGPVSVGPIYIGNSATQHRQSERQAPNSANPMPGSDTRRAEASSTDKSSCRQPIYGNDEKGEWWGIGGLKYRGMTPRPAPNERMCLRDGLAYWESQL
jgi:hypothetical protein